MKQRCLVVDDEPLAQKIIVSYIERIPFLEHSHTCDNAFEALSYLLQQPVDIIFLDINMPELSGLELLSGLNHAPTVILTTAYSEYGALSYEYDVADYLLKPIPFERFLKAIYKVMQRSVAAAADSNSALGEISIEYKGAYKKIACHDILSVEAYGNFCKLYVLHEPSYLLWTVSLKKAITLLPKVGFIRVHRSYIINVQQVEWIKNEWIILTNKQEIPIGKSYKRAVLDKLS